MAEAELLGSREPSEGWSHTGGLLEDALGRENGLCHGLSASWLMMAEICEDTPGALPGGTEQWALVLAWHC